MLNSPNILPMPTKDNLWPKEGPRAIPLQFDFTVQASYAVDLQIQQASQKFSFIQTVFVDNSNNTSALSLQFDILNQTINVPARMQGYFPVLVVNPPRMVATSAGGTKATVFLLNFPVAPAMWPGTGSALTFDANGNLLVSDTKIEAAIANGRMQSQMFGNGNADVAIPLFLGNEMSGVQANAIGNTIVIPAQGAANGWFIKSLYLFISGDATLAAAGELTVLIEDAALVIARTIVSLPAAAGVGFGQEILRIENLNYNSKALNSALNVNLSAALTNGKICVNVCWGQTQNVMP